MGVRIRGSDVKSHTERGGCEEQETRGVRGVTDKVRVVTAQEHGAKLWLPHDRNWWLAGNGSLLQPSMMIDLMSGPIVFD